MNVSEQLIKILTDEGVTHIFGIAGDALNPMISALQRQKAIKWVKTKHEGNASYAAFAQSMLNGNLGVCASTVGPGALHLVNGLYNAKMERTPVLAITGQIPVEHIGTNYHQEVDLTKVFDDICEYQAVVRSPEEAPRVIMRALRIAMNRKAVCRIELPSDIARMDAMNHEFIHRAFRSEAQLTPSEHHIAEAADLINQTEKIGILAGAGCRDARDEVLAFAKKIQAPITHTIRAADIFDHEPEQVVGQTGLIGNPSGYKAVMDNELLIMLGTDFPYTHFLPENTKTIQVDIRPENIGNRTPVDVGLHGDIKVVINALEQKCHRKETSAWMQDLRKSFVKWMKDNCESSDADNNEKVMHPQIVAKEISDIATDDAITVIDTGTAAIWATNFMNFHSERRILGSFNHGSMAVGVPAAIGAQIQFPDREIWALVGDGAFHMSLQDFSTAVEYKLPIKIVVLNNEQLGFVKIEMEEAGLAPNFDALHVQNFDFAAFAKIVGGDGIRVEDVDEIVPALEKAKKSKKPFIIDAKVTSGAISLPPNLNMSHVSNFAMSKFKEMIRIMKGDHRHWDNVREEIRAYIDKEF